MGMVVAHNLAALPMRRNLSTSSRVMSGAMERLSSGYRVNTGKDDPSGIVISEKLRAQLRGVNRAQQNTQETINVLGIAEGGLNEMNAILKKMKALAIHSSNTGVTSAEQIAANQAELDSSIQTLDRIAQTTKFSNENLLNGAKDIDFTQKTAITGTQQNALLDARESSFGQIFKRDGYQVSVNFTGSANADELTGIGDVDFTQQAMKAYLEVDTAMDPSNTTQVDACGQFTQEQRFTLTGSRGSRSFTLAKGESVATLVSQIAAVSDSTGIGASLVFNSAQNIDRTVETGPLPEINREAIVDEPIDIRGLHSVDGQQVGMSFSMPKEDANALRAALEDAGIQGFSFRMEVDDAAARTMRLVLTDEFGGEYSLLSGWSGNRLVGTKPESVSHIGGDDAVAEALLGMQFTTTGSVCPELSVDTETMDFEWGLGETLIAEDIYNTTLYNGAAFPGQGNVSIDIGDLNWGALMKNVPEALKQDFLAAAQSNRLAVQVDVAGNQNGMAPTLSLVDTGPGGQVYFSQQYSRAELGIRWDGQTWGGGQAGAPHTITNGVFRGAKIRVTETSRTGIGYQAGDPLHSTVNPPDRAVPAVSGPALPAQEYFPMGMFSIVPGVDSSVSGATSSVKTAQNTDIQVDFSTNYLAHGDALHTALSLLPGLNNTDLEVFLKASGTDYSTRTHEIVFRDCTGTEYTVGSYDPQGDFGRTSPVTVTPPGAAGSAAVAAALQDIVDTGSSSPLDVGLTYSPFPDSSGVVTPETISSTLYGPVAGEGELQVSFGDNPAEWEALYTSIPDVPTRQAFLASLRAGTLAIKSEITGTDQNAFGLEFTLYDTGTNAEYRKHTLSHSALGIDMNTGTATAHPIMLFGHISATVDLTDIKSQYGFQPNNPVIWGANVHSPVGTNLTGTLRADSRTGSSSFIDIAEPITNKGQAGGITFTDQEDMKAYRRPGTIAVFNNDINTNGRGSIRNGVTSVEYGRPLASDAIVYGKNTDGQGRVYVKFLDNNSYELYKDAAMSQESLVASGINGLPCRAANNSGLSDLVLHLNGDNLVHTRGVYLALAGIEGSSETVIRDADGTVKSTTPGVVYEGAVVGPPEENGDYTGAARFDASRTLISGVSLGRNTSDEGKVYLKNIYNADTNTVQVFAYRDQRMRDEDMVAASEPYITRVQDSRYDPNLPEDPDTNPRYRDVTAMTVVLNEIRNADNTDGTGLGIVLSVDGPAFQNAESATLTGAIAFTNLGARIYSEDYGREGMIKLTQDKGAIFTHYDTPGKLSSATLLEAGTANAKFQVNGQDASLSVNGMLVKTNGLLMHLATQDIQANFVFNQGTVGSTTLAQVGYDIGSIFTKVGALNLGNVDLRATAGTKYEGLSGLLCNAGHVTSETIGEFKGGMQLQIGEGAGDQNRTVVAIKSMTSENLGRIVRTGAWETGSSVRTERILTMKDCMGGGAASLRSDPKLAMAIIEQAISDVSETRAQIGALQANLLQTNVNNLAVTAENITKTESGIRDADMAFEISDFTRGQVLQNAALSMMAQANQQSQNVLQLLS